MSQVATETQVKALAHYDGGRIVRVQPTARDDVRKAVISFIDTIGTGTGQATFYNTKEEQKKAIDAVHAAVYAVNRGLYAAALTLPGVTDYSIQLGMEKLLTTQAGPDNASFLTQQQEAEVFNYLTTNLPPQRLLKFYGMLIKGRVNTNRSRKIILRSLLSHGSFTYWVVKYRNKIHDALRHAWGRQVYGAVYGALDAVVNGCPTIVWPKKIEILNRHVNKYAGPKGGTNELYHALHFALRVPLRAANTYTLPLLNAFMAAKTDITKGKGLPREVLEGIRGRFHKGTVQKSVVLEMSKETMTEGQKMASQRAAAREGVQIEFDPTKQDIVKLYIYCLETGTMNSRIWSALQRKATHIAGTFPLRYQHVGIILDASRSMYGTDQAKYRPLAVGLAMKDVLGASATNQSTIKVAGGTLVGQENSPDGYYVKPSGETSLAEALVDVAEANPDAIYIITDGYENAPAGRVDEVIGAMRELGVETPIYQVTPVLASEVVGVRSLSPTISPLPVFKPEGLGLSLIRAALNNDVEQGILGLLNITVPLLGGGILP